MCRISKRKETQERRKLQICKVYQIKIDKSHLSVQILNHLNLLFTEAKWFYNYCISQDSIKNADYKIKHVQVKFQAKFEIRTLKVLQTHMKQSIKDRIISNIKSLSTKKKNGQKIGNLKYKCKFNSIPLRQYNHNYKVDILLDKIKISSIDKWLKVRGLNQIPKDIEFANANLIRKNNDYYLYITTFKHKEEINVSNTSIGIDFGCEAQLTFSNNIKVKFEVPINKRLKRLDRKISKKNRKNSKNKEKDKLKKNILYERLVNKKKDIKNKIVNIIIKSYKYICFQDEQISNWKQLGHGKKIQNTGIGGIISDLKNKSHTPIIINKFFPSTQLCPNCNNKQKLQLNERIYKCISCNYINDRDVKSAICIEQEGMKQVPMDHREFKLEEILTTGFYNILSKINGVKATKLELLSQEAPKGRS